MATISLASSFGPATCFYDRQRGFRQKLTIFHGQISGPTIRFSSNRRFRIYCDSEIKEKEIRKGSPILERSSFPGHASDEWTSVPDVWRSSAEKYGDRVAMVDQYHDPPTNMTYNQLEQEILDFAEGLRVVGAKPDEKIALYSDNSCRWLVADQGIMAMGGINVVRGTKSAVEELLHIYNHSDSVALVVDTPEFFNRISETLTSKASIRFVILLWGEKSLVSTVGKEIPVFGYQDILDFGRGNRTAMLESHDAGQLYEYKSISSDDVATLVYTSGTTGNPKGVMLTHKNLLSQVHKLYAIVPAVAGDRFVSMLPPWHVYERAAEYFIFTRGAEQVYTSVKNMKVDLERYQPEYMISVPLVFETLYSGIQKQISRSSTARKFLALTLIRVSLAYMELRRIYKGLCLTKNEKEPSYLVSLLDNLRARVMATLLWPLHMLAKMLIYKKICSSIGMSKAAVSGGGSLPLHVDKFFEAIGITIQVGYGLTETSPVIAARRLSHNVLGSVGHPTKHTYFKIVDLETGVDLAHGSTGIIKVKGTQVMKGYYKNPSATKQVLDDDGWLNTGDIGWIAPHHSTGRSSGCGGIIVLDGRAKDTIVLSTGENVEPLAIEEAALRSKLIQQIVVIGQDERRLGAIIVPNKEEMILEAKRLSNDDAKASDLSREMMTKLLYQELRKWTAECSFQVGPILIVDEPFTIDNGLMTATMKIRRDRVVAVYKKEITELFK